jgi:hypothetical protein
MEAMTAAAAAAAAAAVVVANHLAGGVEPVWRQLLQLHLDHPNAGVAQQAAAALAVQDNCNTAGGCTASGWSCDMLL